jgi:hypothetical protein
LEEPIMTSPEVSIEDLEASAWGPKNAKVKAFVTFPAPEH